VKTVIVLNQDQMGHGSRELGQKILATFLRKLPSMQSATAIVFYNSGVQLLTETSPVLAELRELDEHGIDLMPCGTCVEHFGITVAAGHVSNMDAIVSEIAQADKVVTL